MAGCGGSCACSAGGETVNTGVSETLARVIADNRLVRYAVNYSRRNPDVTVEDVVAAVNDAKTIGEI